MFLALYRMRLPVRYRVLMAGNSLQLLNAVCETESPGPGEAVRLCLLRSSCVGMAPFSYVARGARLLRQMRCAHPSGAAKCSFLNWSDGGPTHPFRKPRAAGRPIPSEFARWASPYLPDLAEETLQSPYALEAAMAPVASDVQARGASWVRLDGNAATTDAMQAGDGDPHRNRARHHAGGAPPRGH